MPEKRLRHFISEGFDFGVKDEKDLDGFDAAIGNDKILSLYRQLKKDYPNVEYPLALNRGNGEVKVRIKDFDLPTWKKSNLNKNAGKIKIGMGSINSSGGSIKGAEWEEIICACYNMRSKRVSLDEAKKLAGIEKTWKSKYNSAIEEGFQIVDSAWTRPTGVMEHFGSGSSVLNTKWDQFFIDTTGKSAPSTTRTPKTDMYIGSQHISLKKAGGSQLMSGGKAESLATLAHVYESVPTSIKTKEFNTAWRTLEKDINQKFTKINVGANKSTTDIKREIKAGVKNEVTTAIAEAMENHTAMQNAIREIFSSLEARKEFVREAMTGGAKFSDQLAVATHILVFDPVQGKASYKEINDTLITEYARKVGFQINFKKGGASSTPYTNLRGAMSESIEESFAEEEFDSEMLHEGLLGRIGSGIMRFLSGILGRVWRKLKSSLSRSFKALNRITGNKIDTNNPSVTWKL